MGELPPSLRLPSISQTPPILQNGGRLKFRGASRPTPRQVRRWMGVSEEKRRRSPEGSALCCSAPSFACLGVGIRHQRLVPRFGNRSPPSAPVANRTWRVGSTRITPGVPSPLNTCFTISVPLHKQPVPQTCASKSQPGLHVRHAGLTAKRSTLTPFCTPSNSYSCQLYPNGSQIWDIFQEVWQLAKPRRQPAAHISPNCLDPNLECCFLGLTGK